jgi:hypothetical protein
MTARMDLWNAEQDVDDDLADVDLNLAIGSYGQTYDDGALFSLLVQPFA